MEIKYNEENKTYSYSDNEQITTIKDNEEVKLVTSQKLFNSKIIECFEFLGEFIPENYFNSFRNELKELQELNKEIK